MQYLSIQTGPHLILAQPEFEANLAAEHFTALHWQTQNKIQQSLPGRGQAVQFTHQQQQYVLKHYHRGGLLASLLGDRYLFTGMRRTRALAEFNLLMRLRELGLPVPEPIAIHIQRNGLWYQADLITRLIANSQTLAKRLTQQRLTAALWQQLGSTLKRFHQAGVYHADLNAHNILIDADENIWVIDFDKSYLRAPNPTWQQQNLDRLKRSFTKLQTLSTPFYWEAEEWAKLVAAYEATDN